MTHQSPSRRTNKCGGSMIEPPNLECLVASSNSHTPNPINTIPPGRQAPGARVSRNTRSVAKKAKINRPGIFGVDGRSRRTVLDIVGGATVDPLRRGAIGTPCDDEAVT